VFQAPATPARTGEFLRELLAAPDTALLVADDDGAVVGFANARLRATPDNPFVAPRRYAYVENLAVRRDRQRQGIGRALMDAVQAWALEQGMVEVQLGVWDANTEAVAFYDRLGDQTTQRRMRLRLR
jgi:shikimate dehydrogenase